MSRKVLARIGLLVALAAALVAVYAYRSAFAPQPSTRGRADTSRVRTP